MASDETIERVDELAGWITPQKAAEVLCVDTSLIRRLAEQQVIIARRWGGRALMINQESLRHYLAQRRRPGRPPKLPSE
jgi:hypothetical protein